MSLVQRSDSRKAKPLTGDSHKGGALEVVV